MQNREPPAYQEYASAMLARRNYRMLNLAARGLLDTLRRECWVNGSMPSDPVDLSATLGLDTAAVDAALPKIMSFFAIENGEIRCPELDQYKAHLADRHLKQSAGGKASAVTRANDKSGKSRGKKGFGNKAVAGDAGSPASTQQAPYSQPESTLQGLSTAQPNKTKSNPSPVKGLPAPDPWIAEYDSADVVSAEAYRKASGR